MLVLDFGYGVVLGFEYNYRDEQLKWSEVKVIVVEFYFFCECEDDVLRSLFLFFGS